MDTIGLQFGERLAAEGTLGNATYNEFMRLIAGLHDWAALEHNGDGSHGDITADSLIVETLHVTDDATVDGDLAVRDILIGNVTAPTGSGGSIPAFQGIRLGIDGAADTWKIYNNNDGDANDGLHVTEGGTAVFRIENQGTGKYVLMPRSRTGADGLWLGDPLNLTSQSAADRTVAGILVDGLLANTATFSGAVGVVGTLSVFNIVVSGILSAGDINATDIDVVGPITATTTIDATLGYTERARTTPLGEWTSVAFNAANFTANGAQTWTVASGDQNVYAYTLIGKTMVLSFKISTSTVGGTPDKQLRIAIPGGFTVAVGYTSSNPIAYNQGTWVQGWAEAASSEAFIRLFTTGFGSANWAASTDLTYVQGQITFQVA